MRACCWSIAARLGISYNLARNALACWYERRDERVPDGRSRRSSLAQKQRELPLYQQIAGRAREVYNEGLLLEEIGQRLGHDHATISKAITFWHELRNPPVQ